MDSGQETRRKILADLAKRQLHDATDQTVLAAVSAHALLQDEGADAHLERLTRSLDTSKANSSLAALRGVRHAARESGTQAFVRQYQNWLSKLLGIVQDRDCGDAVRQSGWHTLATLYERLSELQDVPGVRKEASAAARDAAKVALSEGQDLGAEACHAIACILHAVPAALKGSSKQLEEVLAAVLTSTKSATDARLAASRAFALLPSCGTGDEGALLSQRLILTAHNVLDDAFQGMEDPGLRGHARAAVQPGIAPLPGFQHQEGGLSGAAELEDCFLILGGLLDCLEHCLTAALPNPTPLPTAALFMLLCRALSFTDAAIPPERVSEHRGETLALLRRLPMLHSAALKLLTTWLSAGGSALLPLYASVLRLLLHLLGLSWQQGNFRTTARLRSEVYLASSAFVELAGSGAAKEVLQPALSCAAAEFLSQPKASPAGATAARPTKRQKRAKAVENSLAISDATAATAGLVTGSGLEAETEAKKSCLLLLTTLLKVGGAAFSSESRAQLDALALHGCSMSSARLELVSEQQQPGTQAARLAVDLHVTALGALLASVLAPSEIRPLFLPQAMGYFRQGLCSANASLAAFCSDALLACEAILHPAAVSKKSRPLETASAATVLALQNLVPAPTPEPARIPEEAGAEKPGTLTDLPLQNRASPAEPPADAAAAAPKPVSEATRDPSSDDEAVQNDEAEFLQEDNEIFTSTEKPERQPASHQLTTGAADPADLSLQPIWGPPGRIQAASSVEVASDKPASSMRAAAEPTMSFSRLDTLTSDSDGSLPEIDSGVSSEIDED